MADRYITTRIHGKKIQKHLDIWEKYTEPLGYIEERHRTPCMHERKTENYSDTWEIDLNNERAKRNTQKHTKSW